MVESATSGKRIGYVRVSSSTVQAIPAAISQLDGASVDKLFTETAAGKDTKRPQLQAALEAVREGDTLVVASMDRPARSLWDLCRMVRQLTARGAAVEFIREGLTFTREGATPSSVIMLELLEAFAQFERALLRERQQEGIERAKAQGRYPGRRPILGPRDVMRLRRLVKSGMSKAAVARELNISRETLYAYLRRLAAPAGQVETKRLRRKVPRRRA